MDKKLSERGRAVWGPVAKQRNEFAAHVRSLIYSCMDELGLTSIDFGKEDIYSPIILVAGKKEKIVAVTADRDSQKAYARCESGSCYELTDLNISRLLAILKCLTLKL